MNCPLSPDVIKMLCYNIRGLKPHIFELQHILNKQTIDIAIISETHLSEKTKIYIPGYIVHRQDRINRGGGVAIIVKDHIKHTSVQLPDSGSMEMTGIKLNCNSKSTTIVAIYNPPNCTIDSKTLTEILSSNRRVVIAGDYNARHQLWNCLRKNKNGRIIYELVTEKKATLMTPPGPTFLPSNKKQAPSTIDFLLTNCPQIISSPRTKVEGPSDHLPVYFEIGTTVGLTSPDPRFDYAASNWKLFRNTINQNIPTTKPPLSTEKDIDRAVDTLTNTIRDAMNEAIPRRKPVSPNPKLPQHLEELIRLKNKTRSSWQQYRQEPDRKLFRILHRRVRASILDWRKDFWDRKIEVASTQRNGFWKLVKGFSTGGKPQIPHLKSDTRTARSDAEKAETLVDYFKSVHDEAEVRGNKSFVENINSRVIKIVNGEKFSVPTGKNTLQALNPPIKFVSPQELSVLIKKLKNTKAPGHDKIQNIIIKNLPRKAMVTLTNIVNAILRLHYFPLSWKRATVIALPKPGKNPTAPSSYRPVSLLPTLAKLTERVISKRLQTHLDNLNIIPTKQFGFKNRHSTVHQLARVTNDIKTHMTNRTSTALLLLDSQKAFDSVWTNGLIYKLTEFKVPLGLIKLIFSYLSNREIEVKVNSTLSSPRSVPCGVPQGSVLSPVLYNTYIAEIFKVLPKGIDIAGFADDILLYTHSPSPSKAANRIQNAAHLVIQELNRWKIKINTAKTDALLITNSRDAPRSITIRGTRIAFQQSVKYLGIHIDSKLTWRTHIKEINRTANRRLGKLYRLLTSNALSHNLKLIIYKVMIRPCLTYACPVWSTAAPTNMKKLQITQNKTLRIATDTPRRTPVSLLHHRLQIPLLADFIQIQTHKFNTSLPLHSNPLLHSINTTHTPKWGKNHKKNKNEFM